MTEETVTDVHLKYARERTDMLEAKVDLLSKALTEHMLEEEKQKAAIEKKLLIAIVLAGVAAAGGLGEFFRLLAGML